MGAAVGHFIGVFSNATLTWDDLEWLRGLHPLPIVLKGILHPDDAREARERGADGIVVSNHGGRQVDGAIASLAALPPIVEAVGEDIAVLLDSGIRSGADAFKALALGADAVLVGRPYLWAWPSTARRGRDRAPLSARRARPDHGAERLYRPRPGGHRRPSLGGAAE